MNYYFTNPKEHFAKEIAKLRQQTEEGQKKNPNLQRDIENEKVQAALAAKYPALSAYEVYPDFVNPFTIYLAGVYFNLMGDNLKSADLLKESYGMLPDNSYVKDDLAMVEAQLGGTPKTANMTWVIFENGLCPTKEEFRVDLPLFIATNRVYYTGIALPKLEPRQEAYKHLAINAAGTEYRTQTVADVDRIIQTEFKKDFPGILTRAIISASVKAAAQYAMTQQNNNGATIAALMMATYTLVTTTADVRVWTTLPKDIQVARVQIPQNRTIGISGDGVKVMDITVPECNNAIVYIKIPVRQSVSYDIIKF